MLYKVTNLDGLGELRIELSSNSHSDAMPMLRHISFRKLPVDLNAQCLPLAAAILTRSYCGDVFEFSEAKIGSDYADAIRALLSPQTNVVNVNGLNRSFSTGEIDVMVGRAGKGAHMPSHTASTPLARVDWSGDFVNTTTRNSAEFAFGAVQTNAEFFTEAFNVSVAIGLLFGRDRCGSLIVATPATDRRQLDDISNALRIVGITLEAEASPEPQCQNAVAAALPSTRAATSHSLASS